MGHVVVKYKVTFNQSDEGRPDYDGIAGRIDGFDEVQAVLGEGDGIVDAFEDKVREVDPLVGRIEALEMGRL